MNPEAFLKSMKMAQEESPEKMSTPRENFRDDSAGGKLKLYGPLKITRLDQTWGSSKAENKWTYFQDSDNRWNNPNWCKSHKLLEHYHNDKLRRDCMSLDRLMRKTIVEEKNKFNTHKNFIETSRNGKVNRLSDRVKERIALQKDSDQAILDHQEQCVVSSPDDSTNIHRNKQLVLSRSHLLNSLDKSHSNLWNNYKRMDEKHIDQTVIFCVNILVHQSCY